jgi:hypothetical protein
VAGSDNDPGVASHPQLAKELLGSADFDASKGGLDAVVEELRASEATVACLTSEDLSFLYASPAALGRLRDGIGAAGFEPRIVAYLRAQASYCTAVYAENVRHGYRAAFHTYLADVLRNGCYTWGEGTGPPFDYRVLLDGFAAVFGRRAIVARRYRSAAPSAALLASFRALLVPGMRDWNAFTMPKIRYNGSPSFGDVLRLLGAQNELDGHIRFTPLSIADHLRLLGRFAVPNARLAARYGVLVPVLEPLDVALALPLRRSRAKTVALREARQALAQLGYRDVEGA